jgi:hypothetical protein
MYSKSLKIRICAAIKLPYINSRATSAVLSIRHKFLGGIYI